MVYDLLTLIFTDIIDQENILPDQNKITRHQISISDMTLYLRKWEEGNIAAYLRFPEFNYNEYEIKRWHSREEAEREFPALVEKLRRGEYKIDIYDNGRVEVELT